MNKNNLLENAFDSVKEFALMQIKNEKQKQQEIYSLNFAKELVRQILFNPKKRETASQSFSAYSKEEVIRWLKAPGANEKQLRDASIYLYLSSTQYQRLITYYSGLLVWAYVISPLKFDRQKMQGKSDAVRKQFLRVSNLLEMMNLPQIMRDMFTVALRDGAFYGVKYSDSSSFFVQKINPDFCKITSVSDGIFLYSVDMSKITEERLEFYPEEFKAMKRAADSTGVKYQEVPDSISFCLKADASLLDYTIPPLAGVMPALYRIAHLEGLQETADEIKNYKMIAAKVQSDEEGKPLMGWDLVMRYYSMLMDAVGENVGVSLTPFDLESFEFKEGTGVAEVDSIARATSNYWTTAGTSGLLHGIPNNTAGVTKLAIKNDETYVFSMMKQAERLLNRFLKVEFPSTIKFKLTILPITVFNREEYIKMYKESVAFGIGKSYYLAALGIPQYDAEGLDFLEKDVLDLDNTFTPLRNIHNTSAEELQGRPSMDETNLDSEGEATRARDANADR